MIRKLTILFLVGLIAMSCAQVPKESVELSATVGRDLESVYKAHRELAQVLFARMRRDINRFVDDVYAPFQINMAMIRQGELANSSNPEERNKSLLLAINAAFKPGASQQLQKDVLKAMGIMVRKIQNDIEAMRKELLVPLEAQESEVLGSIDRAYQQLHYANSIVTGHLSSVAKVHETQAELLEAIGVERDLRKEVGRNIAKASDEIADLVEAAESIEDNVNKAEKFANDLKDTIDGLTSELKEKPEEG